MNRKELIHAEQRALRRRTFVVMQVVKKVMQQKWAVEIQRIRDADRPRLLTFAVWSERHRVPLSYVIATVVGWARMKTANRKRRKKQKFGMSLAALTSKKTEMVLTSAIEKDFPGWSNWEEWRLREREKAIGLAEPRGKTNSLLGARLDDTDLNNYKSRVERRAKKFDKATAAGWRRRRKWRGNPWV